MLKTIDTIRLPDPYFSGEAGFIGATLENLYEQMGGLELPLAVPESVRRNYDAIRHAYIYSYYSYDLLTLAAAQTFPCLELALRIRVGQPFEGRIDRRGKRRPAMLAELLEAAQKQGLLDEDLESLKFMRNMFAHGSETVVNPPIFLQAFQTVNLILNRLFAEKGAGQDERS